MNHKATTYPVRPDVPPECRRIYHVKWDKTPGGQYWTHVSFRDTDNREHVASMKGHIEHYKACELAVDYWRREYGFLFLTA